jgi:uncharacterized protein (DUF2062 family)
MLVGAVPLGLAAGFVAYLIVKLIVRTYQHARKRHLEASRAARAETE